MSVQKRNTWDIQPPCEPDSTTHEVSLSAWAHEFGVIPALVPFELRRYEAWFGISATEGDGS